VQVGIATVLAGSLQRGSLRGGQKQNVVNCRLRRTDGPEKVTLMRQRYFAYNANQLWRNSEQLEHLQATARAGDSNDVPIYQRVVRIIGRPDVLASIMYM